MIFLSMVTSFPWSPGEGSASVPGATQAGAEDCQARSGDAATSPTQGRSQGKEGDRRGV